MNPKISIIMTAYQRARQLRETLGSIANQESGAEVIVVEDGDDGETQEVCREFGVKYLQRKNRPEVAYANCAPLLNCGIRAAQGEILIIQNAECKHVSENVIASLVAPHRPGSRLAVFAAAARLNLDGSIPEGEPSNLTSPYFFCGSINKEWLLEIGGLDEEYTGWGLEDDDLALRLRWIGVQFAYLPEVIVHHQWHPVIRAGHSENQARFERKYNQLWNREIGPVANQGRAWGQLN